MNEVAFYVDTAIGLQLEIEERQETLKKIKAKLIELGAGDHKGVCGKASVIEPGPSIKATEVAMEYANGKLDKTQFAKLFERKLTFAPVKAFRDVARALLKPAQAEKLITTFEAPSTAYVKLTPFALK